MPNTSHLDLFLIDGKSLDLSGEISEVSGSLNINLFDFFSVSGTFAFEKSQTVVNLSDGSENVEVDTLSIAAFNVNAFVGVNGGKSSTLTDPHQRHLIIIGRLPDEIDAVVQVLVDIVVQRDVTVNAGGISPVDDIQIEPLFEQLPHQTPVRLQI